METLAAGNEPFRYVNTDIKYSYVVLRKDRNIAGNLPVPPVTGAAVIADPPPRG